MAHCINCDRLISDRPSHSGFCDDECREEYESGANSEILAVNTSVNNQTDMENHKHETNPDVKDIFKFSKP
jgi:hypothetical protein